MSTPDPEPVDVAVYRQMMSEREAAETNELLVAREAIRLAIASNRGYQRPDLEALHLGWSALNREAEALAEETDEICEAWVRQQRTDAAL